MHSNMLHLAETCTLTSAFSVCSNYCIPVLYLWCTGLRYRSVVYWVALVDVKETVIFVLLAKLGTIVYDA